MSENNYPNENEALDQVEEAVEETVEEAVEDIEEVADDFADEISEDAEASIEFDEFADPAPAKTKSSPLFLIIAIILAILLVVSILTSGFQSLFPNKYNKLGYPESNVTIAQVAEACDMSLAEFLETCHLPADMPGSTRQDAAIYALPTDIFAQISGLDFDQVKEMLMLPDTVTEDTIWSDAQGEAPLRAYVGEDSLAGFKENYNLGDEVTVDTTWKEVREIVYHKDLIDQAKSQWDQVIALMANINAPAEDPATDDIATEEVPAEEVPAEDIPADAPAEEAPAAE